MEEKIVFQSDTVRNTCLVLVNLPSDQYAVYVVGERYSVVKGQNKTNNFNVKHICVKDLKSSLLIYLYYDIFCNSFMTNLSLYDELNVRTFYDVRQIPSWITSVLEHMEDKTIATPDYPAEVMIDFYVDEWNAYWGKRYQGEFLKINNIS